MKDLLILKSNEKEIIKAQEYLHKLQEEKQWPCDFFFRIEVCVLEAVKNAIVHGNKHAENKVVTLEVIEGKEDISFRVIDQGEGFDRGGIVDPRQVSRRCLENGRGLLIMEEFTDKIIYSANCVDLFFSESGH